MPNGVVFLVGIGLFFAGGLTCLIVLFSQGGASKSKQFEVIGNVLSGKQGRGPRIALFLGGGTLFVGTMTSFAGVAAGDAERRQRCVKTCRSRGYAEGIIRGSKATDPKVRTRAAFVACACSRGPAPDPLELRADSL